MVQFIYSGDGLDPTEMEGDSKPIDFARFMDNIRVRNMSVITSLPSSFLVSFFPVAGVDGHSQTNQLTQYSVLKSET